MPEENQVLSADIPEEGPGIALAGCSTADHTMDRETALIINNGSCSATAAGRACSSQCHSCRQGVLATRETVQVPTLAVTLHLIRTEWGHPAVHVSIDCRMEFRLLVALLVIVHTLGLPAQLLSKVRRTGAQPPGIKSKIYNCTYPASGLSLNVSGSMVDCGSVNGKPHSFRVKDITELPRIWLQPALPEGLYAAFLLNPLKPSPGSSFVSPILHAANGNIAGSSLGNGQFGAAHTISKFFPPNPPLPGLDFETILR